MKSDSLYHAVKSLVDNHGINITHILSYTGPGSIDNSGSSISTRVGARSWTTERFLFSYVNGQLVDMESEYLGGALTGVTPESARNSLAVPPWGF
ncbi:hypothetical protein Cpir12675_006112 [Ceratocystis pirilliformis]|uniref:Uncharacterized protein n=1 Tax=Ceratocystis pirilliformis TaxID=259994 RepID=A0ABR3YL30_9PEZI